MFIVLSFIEPTGAFAPRAEAETHTLLPPAMNSSAFEWDLRKQQHTSPE
jgi:hypothetical protein